MQIRDARPDDARRLAEIDAVSWQAAYRGLLAAAFLDQLTPSTRLEWWTARLARVPPRWAILVVEREGTVAGFVTMGHCDDHDRRDPESGELFAMYVDPADWGRGYGRMLLLGAETRFREEAYSDASLWVLEANRRARRFYETGGWQVDDAGKRMVIGADAVNACRYVRELKQD